MYTSRSRFEINEGLTSEMTQSPTQSPHTLWSVVGCQEKIWGSGLFSPQNFCGKIYKYEPFKTELLWGRK